MSSLFSGRKQPPSDSSSFPPALPQEIARQPVGFETILGAGATLKGDLRSQGNVRLDGTFEGTLEIDGNVLVGEAAKITADINAKNVSIAGAVRGDVSGKKVQLLRTARVWGGHHRVGHLHRRRGVHRRQDHHDRARGGPGAGPDRRTSPRSRSASDDACRRCCRAGWHRRRGCGVLIKALRFAWASNSMI